MQTAGPVRRIAVRRSGIHGRGVVALRSLSAGERIIEYRGEIIPWSLATERYHAQADSGPSLTYFFDLGDGRVIDGASAGNSARFVNHGCRPNCEAIDDGGRIYLHAIDDIPAGTELLLDYALQLDDPDDPDLRALYACSCSAAECRGTMVAPQAE